MKKALPFVALGVILSFFSNQTNPISLNINRKLRIQQISDEAGIKEDNYDYPFDAESRFTGTIVGMSDYDEIMGYIK